MPANNIDRARSAKTKIKQRLENAIGVTGIGIAWTPDGEAFVVVNVAPNMTEPIRAQLHDLDQDLVGVSVEIDEVSDVHAQ